MKLTVDIHPSMYGSPTEIGELVQKQMEAEANGTKVTPLESAKFVKGLGIVGKVEQWERTKLFSNKDKFVETMSGKKYGSR